MDTCAVCGWPLKATAAEGCITGNCSMRPLPQFFAEPDRALAEGYSRETVEAHRRPPPPPCPECARLREERDQLSRSLASLSEHAVGLNADLASARRVASDLMAERDEARAEADAWRRKSQELLMRAREVIVDIREMRLNLNMADPYRLDDLLAEIDAALAEGKDAEAP